MHKELLRAEILKKRAEVASRALSASICEKAAALPEFLAAKTVMVYLSNGSEVDTSRLIALAHMHGKAICAPRVLGPSEMEAAMLDASGFRRGAFGILEPAGNTCRDIDIIFVPGVAFDTKGNRIGYGKGYYDRFLKAQQAATVGLAYSAQVVDFVPASPYDVRLHKILTEEGVCV